MVDSHVFIGRVFVEDMTDLGPTFSGIGCIDPLITAGRILYFTFSNFNILYPETAKSASHGTDE